MSQSPSDRIKISDDHPYAEASRQLNRLVRLGHAFSGHERNCVYLNTDDGRFANASGSSGMAFDDDGRALALCDWDHDGDLDCWVANRSAPQIRFMSNQLRTSNHFLALRLVGKTVNRDAIGAQVRVICKNQGSEQPVTILRSVRAGEGYLGQNSKWLHFGLGKHQSISQIDVRWPGGEWEIILGIVEVDQFYELRQGQPRLQPVELRRVEISGSEPAPILASDGSSRKLLSQPVRLPSLPYTSVKSGETADAAIARDNPVLITLWAPWCGNCRKEFAQWNLASKAIQQAGLKVIAVNVDGLSLKAGDVSKQERENASPDLAFTHESATATSQLVALLQLVNDVLVYRDDHRALPLPTSLLIDEQGDLAAIYKGPAPIVQVLSDFEVVNAGGESRLDAALPFPGKWLAAPVEYNYENFVARLWEEQLGDTAITYSSKLADRLKSATLNSIALRNARGMRDMGKVAAAKEQLENIVRVAPTHTAALTELGVLAGRDGELGPAVAYLERAVESSPEDVTANFNLGLALRKQGKFDEARSAVQAALKGDPQLTEGHATLGQLLARARKFKEAAEAFGRAHDLEPQNVEHAFNQTTALIEAKQLDAALRLLADMPQTESLSPRITRYRGEIYERQGKLSDAILEFRRLLKSAPETPALLFRVAQLCEKSRRYSDGLDAYQQLLKLAPNDPVIESRVAWLLACTPDAKIRIGTNALKLAVKAAESTKRKNPLVLDALAAAQAEVGDFASALKTVDEAIAIAVADQRESFAAELRARKTKYEQRQPHRLTAANQ